MSDYRDSQRDKVYSAEAAAARAAVKAGSERATTDVTMRTRLSQDQCVDLINKVCDRFNVGRLQQVTFGKGGGTSWYRHSDARVHLQPWGMCMWTILHEVAHHVNDVLGNMSRAPGHGVEWAATHLMILDVFAPAEFAANVRRQYDKHGVDYVDFGKQARTFLNMAIRKPDPSYRRIQFLLADGTTKRGSRIISWDRKQLVLGCRHSDMAYRSDFEPTAEDTSGELVQITHVLDAADIRYATYIDPEPRGFFCPCCPKAFETEAKLLSHVRRERERERLSYYDHHWTQAGDNFLLDRGLPLD